MSDERGCIIVADDEEALRRALTRKLEKVGHTVHQASTGAEALALVETHAVDVVLTDITMPDMDGISLLRQVRDRKPDVPVLLMTGAPHVDTAVKAVEYGALEYLTKPFDLERLAGSVARAVKEHRAAVARRQLLDSAVRSKGGVSGPRSAGGSPITTGTVLGGRYRITEMLGAGGMGTVYAAEREDLGRMSVALKVLHPKLSDRPDLLVRFRREAEVVATLQHPNIVNVIDFIAGDDGPTFLVMERLRGRTLAAAILDEQSLSERRVAFIAFQMLGALQAAHEKHVVHRDLKPENVFLTSVANIADVVKLLDFGIAKLADDAASKLTDTGTVLGTPAYMAPEYARGEKADALGDIYAVGCVMYEALARKQPFTAANYNALLFAIQEKEAQPLRTIRPDVSEAMAAIIARAMSKNPKERFQTATAMADALEPHLPAMRKVTPVLSMESAPTEELKVPGIKR